MKFIHCFHQNIIGRLVFLPIKFSLNDWPAVVRKFSNVLCDLNLDEPILTKVSLKIYLPAVISIPYTAVCFPPWLSPQANPCFCMNFRFGHERYVICLVDREDNVKNRTIRYAGFFISDYAKQSDEWCTILL